MKRFIVTKKAFYRDRRVPVGYQFNAEDSFKASWAKLYIKGDEEVVLNSADDTASEEAKIEKAVEALQGKRKRTESHSLADKPSPVADEESAPKPKAKRPATRKKAAKKVAKKAGAKK